VPLPVIVSANVFQQNDRSYGVVWQAALPSFVPPGVTVKILRSYVESGGFVEIGEVPIQNGAYLDEAHRDTSKTVDVFYTLRVTAPEGTKDYGPYSIEDTPDAVARYMTRAVNQMLRMIGATPVLIYQEALGPETERCPECWDAVMQQVIASNCSTCGGTTFVGETSGYYSPVLTLMDIRPSQNITVVEDTAQVPRTTTARMSNYPRLRGREVVRELNTGRLWKVVSVTPVQKDQRALISQDPITIREIKPGEIEQELPIPATLIPVLRRRHTRLERVFRLVDGQPTLVEVWV